VSVLIIRSECCFTIKQKSRVRRAFSFPLSFPLSVCVSYRVCEGRRCKPLFACRFLDLCPTVNLPVFFRKRWDCNDRGEAFAFRPAWMIFHNVHMRA